MHTHLDSRLTAYEYFTGKNTLKFGSAITPEHMTANASLLVNSSHKLKLKPTTIAGRVTVHTLKINA